jgi:hypothetical protein
MALCVGVKLGLLSENQKEIGIFLELGVDVTILFTWIVINSA